MNTSKASTAWNVRRRARRPGDLRSAASCDDYAKLLPAVLKNGDQRSSATLRAVRHNDGCGADGKQDCYACLRDSSLLEDALKAVEKR